MIRFGIIRYGPDDPGRAPRVVRHDAEEVCGQLTHASGRVEERGRSGEGRDDYAAEARGSRRRTPLQSTGSDSRSRTSRASVSMNASPSVSPSAARTSAWTRLTTLVAAANLRRPSGVTSIT